MVLYHFDFWWFKNWTQYKRWYYTVKQKKMLSGYREWQSDHVKYVNFSSTFYFTECLWKINSVKCRVNTSIYKNEKYSTVNLISKRQNKLTS